jgi:hypothetical protein
LAASNGPIKSGPDFKAPERWLQKTRAFRGFGSDFRSVRGPPTMIRRIYFLADDQGHLAAQSPQSGEPFSKSRASKSRNFLIGIRAVQ